VTPNWDSLFDRLSTAKVPEWDREAIGHGLVKVWETWAQEDLAGYKLFATELSGQEPVPHKIDLVLTSDGHKLCDWKTKWTGQLDDKWELRESRSPQRKIYAAAAATLWSPDIFPIRYEVRGIRLGDEKPATKTLSFVITESEAAEAVRHVRDVEAMRHTLVERGQYPWPRHEAGCRLYGPAYKCEYEDYCWNGVRVPATDLVRIEKAFSHSSVKEFMRCPERYRLMRSLDQPEEDGEGANVSGDFFHQLMEMLYKDIFQVSGTTNSLVTS
jgi:hypothetical protein